MAQASPAGPREALWPDEKGIVMRLIFRATEIAVVLGALTATLTGAGQPAATAAAATGHRANGSAASPASPWSQTNENAAASRANLTEKTLTRTTVSKVRFLRSMTAQLNPPNGNCAQFTPVVTPVLTGGDLYAITNGKLSKYNAATGRLIWRIAPDPTFGVGFESLAVAGGLVVLGEVGCDSVSDPNGFVQAVRVSNGARAWSKPITPAGGSLSQLAVSGGYVAATGDSPGSGNVVAVRRLATGALVWNRLSSECGPSVALVVAQVVISYSCDDNGNRTVVANKLATGAKVWSKAGNWVLQRGDTDATTGRHVYVTNPQGTVVSLDPLTGNTQYTLAGATSVLAVDNLRAYAVCATFDVCAYNLTSGKLRWQAEPGLSTTIAAEAGGVLYLDNGAALNTGTGTTITTVWAGLQPTYLVVGDGRIAVVSDPRVVDLFGLPKS